MHYTITAAPGGLEFLKERFSRPLMTSIGCSSELLEFLGLIRKRMISRSCSTLKSKKKRWMYLVRTGRFRVIATSPS